MSGYVRDGNWTDETDQEAEVFFASLTDAEIRHRQDLCSAQIVMAYRQENTSALSDLQRMESALAAAMMKRIWT